jgi:DNA-binding CsgD family transcriptional regulator
VRPFEGDGFEGESEGNGKSSLAPLAQACHELSRTHRLTPRECDILLLLAGGRDTPYIANQLFISKNTVRTHIKNLYVKIDVHNKQDLLDLLHATDAQE